MARFGFTRLALAVALLVGGAAELARAAEPPDTLAEGFVNPPTGAQPRVWWPWLSGNVTEPGIREDLEWMHRVGIGGVTQIGVSFEGWPAIFDSPQLVKPPVEFGTPAWEEAVRYSAAAAQRLGLEFAVDSSPGWTSTGGPWVRPAQAMKKLVWSELRLEGGRRFRGRLPEPPHTTGLFQNIPLVELGAAPEQSQAGDYGDVAVLAYRAPKSAASRTGPRLNNCQVIVRSSAGPIDAKPLCDGDLANSVTLPFAATGNAWIEFEYPRPTQIQALTGVIGPPLYGLNPLFETREEGWLEAGDGEHFKRVVALPRNGAPEQTVSFAPVTAKNWRVVLQRPEPSPLEKAGMAPAAVGHRIAELVLHSDPRVNRFEDKAGYSTRQITGDDDTPSVADAESIRPADVVDLTARVHADGSLDWMPPPGEWTVLRFGYSLIGRSNHPAAHVATGLEVNKLDADAMTDYARTYLHHYDTALGCESPCASSPSYLMLDSFEAGAQNWTDDLLTAFAQLRGYDPHRWLPVLTGRVVDSAASSDRFLWDFRATLSDLIAARSYGQLAALLHARGMGLYAESHEAGRALIADGMEVKKWADVPMGAMWSARRPVNPIENYDADLRESASVAHLYGKPLVAAESFTAAGNPYGFSPQELKALADREIALGVNRFVFADSTHQVEDRPGPGLSLGPYGIRFTRKETWAEQARPWLTYLARSAFLMQQGQFVADIAYLYGEDTNLTSRFHASAPDVPAGYNFDYVNSEALRKLFSVEQGQLATPSGMRYRVLMLDPGIRQMSVPVLRALRDLVRGGAMVVGSAPVSTPSLGDSETEFRAMVRELWGSETGGTQANAVGRLAPGRVITDVPVAQVLAQLGVAPEITFREAPKGAVRFVHRRLDAGDVYFLSTSATLSQDLEVGFRTNGREPELWDADRGSRTSLAYRVEQDRSWVKLHLDPGGAVFVVFRHPATDSHRDIVPAKSQILATLSGPWDVHFPPGLGAPAAVRLEELQSWATRPEQGVKYFSGTGTYHKHFRVEPSWVNAGTRLVLDLGGVKDLAHVRVNGHDFDELWKAPFVLDITAAVHRGDNQLEVDITNRWANRLIGDRQPGASAPFAFASFDPFKADSPLLPAGLLGPVTLVQVQESQ